MKAVWICQCLCPERHCLLAVAGEAGDEHEAALLLELPLRGQVRALIDEGSVNPWCRLCAAPPETWRYEIGRTRFRSMAEALPELQRAEAEQTRMA